MDYYIDEESFGAPYDLAIAEANQAFIDAGREVKGANARSEAAQRNLEDLLAFRKEVGRRIREGSFADLSGLRDKWLRRIEHYHQLTVGCWRGLFLVAPDGSAAVAVVFSKGPHEYRDRLDELKEKHAAKLVRGPKDEHKDEDQGDL